MEGGTRSSGRAVVIAGRGQWQGGSTSCSCLGFLKQVLVPGLENLITDYKKPVVFVLAKGIRKQSRIFRVLICISLRQCKA